MCTVYNQRYESFQVILNGPMTVTAVSAPVFVLVDGTAVGKAPPANTSALPQVRYIQETSTQDDDDHDMIVISTTISMTKKEVYPTFRIILESTVHVFGVIRVVRISMLGSLRVY